MKPSTLQLKAQSLLALDARRKAHHAALSSLHASPLPDLTATHYEAAFLMKRAHEQRGLKMWRKLRRIEALAHDAATAYCNGDICKNQFGSFDFCHDESAWEAFKNHVNLEVRKVFGAVPHGFYVNGDARGMALCLDSEQVTIPQGMQTNWGGDGILAAEITL